MDDAEDNPAAEPLAQPVPEPGSLEHLPAPAVADMSARSDAEEIAAAASTTELCLLPYDATHDELQIIPPFWGVDGLSRIGFPGMNGFSIWHLDMPDRTASEASASHHLAPAAEHVRNGDVIFITAGDGTVMRSLLRIEDCVFMRRIA